MYIRHKLSSLMASCKMKKTSIILITPEELAKGLFRLTSPPKGHDTLGLETRPLQKGPFSFFHLTRIILELSLKYFTRNLPPTPCSFTRGKSNSYSWKKQPKTNTQTHTIKRPHLNQIMYLSFYQERNHDLTGSFKAFDPPFHIFHNLNTLKIANQPIGSV